MRRRLHRSRDRQRGASLLEFALVAPILLLILFGVGEFGLAWISANRLEGAVSAAARVASSQGSTADADRAVLLQLQASLPEELLNNVTRVVIYESDATGYMHPNCTSGAATSQTGVSGRCNRYNGATLRNPNLATMSLSTPMGFWPPADRDDELSGSPPDFIGVYVETRHDDFSGTFWSDGFVLERSSIYRIQPDITG